MRFYLTFFACVLATHAAAAQGTGTAASGPLTLQQAIEMAQKNSLQARAALGTRDAARERDNAFSARLLPQISLAGNLPIYSRTIVPVTQPDGTTLFLPVRQTSSDLAMVVSQRIPYTGAQLTMSSSLNQVKRSGTAGVPETWQSTPFNLSISQPILRSNVIGWERELNGLPTGKALDITFLRETDLFREAWGEWPLPERREIVGLVLERAWVIKARQTGVRPTMDRFRFWWVGEERPQDLTFSTTLTEAHTQPEPT